MISAEANPQLDAQAGSQQQAQLLATVRSWHTEQRFNAWVSGLVAAHRQQQRDQNVAAAGAMLPRHLGIRGFYQNVYSSVGDLSDSLKTGIVRSFSGIYHIAKYPLMGLGAASALRALSSNGNSGYYALLAAGVAAGVFWGRKDCQRAEELMDLQERSVVVNNWLQAQAPTLERALAQQKRDDQLLLQMQTGGAQLQADIRQQGEQTVAVVNATGAAFIGLLQAQHQQQLQANAALANGIFGLRAQLNGLGGERQQSAVGQLDVPQTRLALTSGSGTRAGLTLTGVTHDGSHVTF